jgi:hypothetical protein
MKKTPDQTILKWIEDARKAMEENTQKEWPTCNLNWNTLAADFGPSFIRLWVDSPIYPNSRKSAYCFLDYQGNIYKAAGWKAPAKGIRGHIEKKNPREISSSTGWLYAR